MAITFSGMLDGNVESISMNSVRFTHKGRYGVHVNWSDNQGEGYHAVIDQWEGLREKEDSPADDHPIGEATPGMVTVEGQLISTEAWENWKRSLESHSAVINWTKEENHLELTFDRAGDQVTGSLTWQAQANYTYTDPDRFCGVSGSQTETYTILITGNLTGTYSGEGMHALQGMVTGSVADTANGIFIRSGSFDGTWSADIDANGQISGQVCYSEQELLKLVEL